MSTGITTTPAVTGQSPSAVTTIRAWYLAAAMSTMVSRTTPSATTLAGTCTSAPATRTPPSVTTAWARGTISMKVAMAAGSNLQLDNNLIAANGDDGLYLYPAAMTTSNWTTTSSSDNAGPGHRPGSMAAMAVASCVTTPLPAICGQAGLLRGRSHPGA